jgi:hypothetical protein
MKGVGSPAGEVLAPRVLDWLIHLGNPAFGVKPIPNRLDTHIDGLMYQSRD